MDGRWVAAESFLPPQGGIVWDVDYTGHPYLDPSLPDRDSRLRRWTEFTWDRIRDDDDAYRREAARLLRPLRGGDDEVPPCAADIAVIAEYLQEADVYLYSAIDLLPTSARAHVVPLEDVNRCHDLRDLLAMVFAGGDPRRRFEAQRKVYLANLLLDIDHSRLIQDGPLHLAYFEELLNDALWRYRRQEYEVQIGYHVADDGQTIRYSARPGKDDQIFTFHSSFLERRQGRRKTSLDVLYWNCRFKRSVEPLSFEVVDGQHRVLERVRWGDMRQHRSGPVLSKMIRRGINNPSEIADLLGAMFIVHDEDAVNDLLELLDAGLGNPVRLAQRDGLVQRRRGRRRPEPLQRPRLQGDQGRRRHPHPRPRARPAALPLHGGDPGAHAGELPAHHLLHPRREPPRPQAAAVPGRAGALPLPGRRLRQGLAAVRRGARTAGRPPLTGADHSACS